MTEGYSRKRDEANAGANRMRLFFDASELELIDKAGHQGGVSTLVLAREFQPYTTLTGVSGEVKQGKLYIEVSPHDDKKGFTEFWDALVGLRQEQKRIP